MASVYLVLKLERMYRSTAQGLKMRVCMCVRVCVVGGRVKNWYFSLKDSEGGGISEIKIQNKKKNKKNTEHSEIKHSEITTTQFQNVRVF